MAGQNDFLIFDENNENILTQQQYASDEDRINGFKKGLARSNVKNKVLKQTSTMVAALGEVISDRGYIATDEDKNLLKNSIDKAFSLNGNGSFPVFCFNSGPVDEKGEAVLITLKGTSLIQNAPAVCTSADGQTFYISESISADISGLANGNYKCYYNTETNGLELYQNNIYIQKKEPENWQVNDIWIDTSVKPYKSKQKKSNVEIIDSSLVMSADIFSTETNEDLTIDIRNNPYNKSLEPECANIELSNVQPSQNFKEMSVDWGMPDYASGVSFGSGFVAPSAGWIFGYTRANSGSDGSSLYVNGLMSGKSQGGNTIQDPVSLYALVAKGDIVTLVRMSGTFYPMKGVTNA